MTIINLRTHRTHHKGGHGYGYGKENFHEVSYKAGFGDNGGKGEEKATTVVDFTREVKEEKDQREDTNTMNTKKNASK